jgi:hypothetical protein
MSNAKLGIGLATGMAFHAPAGTSLPTYPTDIIGDNGDGTSTDNFTATSAQVSFTLSESANAIVSFTVDGTEQASTDYSVSGTTVTWSGTSFVGGEKIVITYFVGAWRIIGDVTHDGITVATDKSVNNIRNWANVIKRSTLSEHTETVQVPLMDTTEDALKVVVGSSNVTVTAATLTHGKTIDVDLSAGSLPSPEAFIFIMKDGDDVMAVGMSNGQITAVDNITFAPESTINWTPTITAQEGGLHFISEEG